MAAVFLTALSVIGTLAGTWLGSHLTAAREGRQWRRDRRLEAYTDVMTWAHALTNEANKLFLDLYDDDENKQRNVLFEKIENFHRAIQRAILLGSPTVTELLTQISAHFGNTALKAGEIPKMPHADWEQMAGVDCGLLIGKFCEEAKRELDTDVKSEWRRPFGRRAPP